MAAPLQEFKNLLKEFKNLSVWTVGAGVTVPFAAALASLSPPWPPAIVMTTAISQLVALIVTYHLFRHSSRRTITKLLTICFVGVLLFSSLYLFCLSALSFQHPRSGERYVRGLVCTQDAALVYRESCPFLRVDQISEAGYQLDRLWTAPSLAGAQLSLAILWTASFIALAALIGGFLAYQIRSQTAQPNGAIGAVKKTTAK